MLTPVVQRWREHRDSYRPAREVIDTRRFEVALIADDTTARTFIVAHHYSKAYVAARYRFGLYRRDELVGVAVFSQPISDKLLDCLPGAGLERVELGRFVLLDQVGANAETWMLARCFDALEREGIVGVVSLSDPIARTAADGACVFPGHVGTIYQAKGGAFLGRATPRTLRLLPDGTVFSDRARSKVRRRERGWRYAVEQLVSHGAVPPRAGEELDGWLARELPRVTRPLRHPGNLKYAWALRRRDRRFLPASLPYPKFSAPVSAGGNRHAA